MSLERDNSVDRCERHSLIAQLMFPSRISCQTDIACGRSSAKAPTIGRPGRSSAFSTCFPVKFPLPASFEPTVKRFHKTKTLLKGYGEGTLFQTTGSARFLTG